MYYALILVLWLFSPMLVRELFKNARKKGLETGEASVFLGVLFAFTQLPLLVILQTTLGVIAVIDQAVKLLGRVIHDFAKLLSALTQWIIEGKR